MHCSDNDRSSCCGDCFIGKTKITDLINEIITAAHEIDGKVVIMGGLTNFSTHVTKVEGSLISLVGTRLSSVTTGPGAEWSEAVISNGKTTVILTRDAL